MGTLTLALVARHFAVDVVLQAAIPIVLYAALVSWHNGEWWFRLASWWRPWTDATLFAALTALVHDSLYYGGTHSPSPRTPHAHTQLIPTERTSETIVCISMMVSTERVIGRVTHRSQYQLLFFPCRRQLWVLLP